MIELGSRSLSLLLDQGMPMDAAELFRQLGYGCWHVAELEMQRAEDEEIIAAAQERGCVVITLDSDFHAIIAVQGLGTPSVIRLRREGCKAEEVVEILGPVLEHFVEDLESGVLISVKERHVRSRRLPVGGGWSL